MHFQRRLFVWPILRGRLKTQGWMPKELSVFLGQCFWDGLTEKRKLGSCLQLFSELTLRVKGRKPDRWPDSEGHFAFLRSGYSAQGCCISYCRTNIWHLNCHTHVHVCTCAQTRMHAYMYRAHWSLTEETKVIHTTSQAEWLKWKAPVWDLVSTAKQ